MENTVVKVLRGVAERQPDVAALMSKDQSGAWQSITYKEFARASEVLGAGLIDFGVKRGDHVGIISDNRKEWIFANQAILGIGAVDVPRGSDTMPDEARFILNHADCALSFVENAEQLKKILSRKEGLPLLKTVIVIDEGFRPEGFIEPTKGLQVTTYRDIEERGRKLLARDPDAYAREVEKGSAEELATLIYTSGTTGEPKGVMLTNANFLHNLRTIPATMDIGPGDIFLSVLPVWHSFERCIGTFVLSRGATLAYSKPIGKIMLADMASARPTVMASVPRIWESVRASVYRTINEEGGNDTVRFGPGLTKDSLDYRISGTY